MLPDALPLPKSCEFLDHGTVLPQWGISLESITEIVEAAERARRGCGIYTPNMMRMIVGWGTAVEATRLKWHGAGYKPWVSGFRGIEGVIDAEGKRAIVYTTGDEGTGVRDQNPSNQHSKGFHTRLTIQSNKRRQTLIFEEDDHEAASNFPEEVWFLLARRTSDSVKLELCLPIEFRGGHIIECSKRILLPTINLNSDVPVDRIADPVETDFDITRIAGT